MLEVYLAAADLQDRCRASGWRFCVIGGLALQRWGEPRETIDVDVTLLTGFGNEAAFARELLTWYQPRVPNAFDFAIRHRVVLVQAASGVGLDIAFGAMPFEEAAVDRATDYEFAPGVTIRTASAEDLIVFKAFAARPKDWIDIEGIVIRQGDRLDWELIQRYLSPLVELKEEPEILTNLAGIRLRAGESDDGE